MDAITLAAAKKFAKDTAMRMGAVKGAAVQIQSVEEITGGHKVIFKWEDNAGGVHTESIDVMDGVTPLVYKKCPNIATSDLAAGDSFSAPKSDFNREPLDGDEFFTYLTATSAEEQTRQKGKKMPPQREAYRKQLELKNNSTSQPNNSSIPQSVKKSTPWCYFKKEKDGNMRFYVRKSVMDGLKG